MAPIIETKYGKIEGRETESSFAFLGVPYAKPPVGKLRFHAPQPPEPWEGVYQADHFGNRSMQRDNHAGDFYGKEFFSDPAFIPPMSEDCLYLNIWAPKDVGKAPVAIWYHGGGFEGGHGSEPEFDGVAFAKRGVILVTVNYRLGFLGYFCHPELRDENGHSGNYGFLDQIAALDWVRENIAVFGGDPDCVTIFGQSAGGMAVRDLVCSSMVKGKISRAIIQSCNGYKGVLRVDFTMEQMEKISERFLKRKKLTVDDIKAMSAEDLVKLQSAYNAYAAFKTRAGLSLTPVVDGWALPVIPDQAAEKGETARINYMTGSTKNDMTVSRAGVKDPRKSKIQKSLMRWSGMHTKQGLNSYSYHFARELPGDKAGAFHSSELWYVFGTLSRCWRPMTEHDYALSEKMTDAWVGFIKTGDPGWEPCSGENGFYFEFE